VLTAALTEVGVAPAPALALAATQGLKDQLKDNTAEAAARGAYGVPTFFLGTQMFVGNDRLQFVEKALSPVAARSAP
jgi:2-hydroxychromene-2-carboxylate isomerase